MTLIKILRFFLNRRINIIMDNGFTYHLITDDHNGWGGAAIENMPGE